ncbi:ABC transporter substrate-binding protein [Aquimarina algicola]|uniref:Cobalamin-binding protein n=1 Tax=Aquimarina algicola TaxID=2589995 RepID=A0A504J802_9FLAO|nr:helical backbone metal receptor [Aquimarina algicola]TPN84652.1 cobalamin-binding protein [Aquimarina algicola]
MIYTDQIGREIEILDTPKRIISLVPSQTELLVDLGLEDSIVGVTKFCIHPKSLKEKTAIVGGTKKVKYEKIRTLNPDIILCNKEENTKEIVENLEKEYKVHVTDISILKDALEMISQYGNIFNVEKTATDLVNTIISQKEGFDNFIKDIPKKRVAYFIWRDPWMVTGSGTFIDHMLSVNGFDNAFGNKERYPEIPIDGLKSFKNIDLILLSSEPYPFAEKHVEEIKHMIPNIPVILVDGEYFSWYGSRLVNAFSYFKTLQLSIT